MLEIIRCVCFVGWKKKLSILHSFDHCSEDEHDNVIWERGQEQLLIDVAGDGLEFTCSLYFVKRYPINGVLLHPMKCWSRQLKKAFVNSGMIYHLIDYFNHHSIRV